MIDVSRFRYEKVAGASAVMAHLDRHRLSADTTSRRELSSQGLDMVSDMFGCEAHDPETSKLLPCVAVNGFVRSTIMV